MRKNTWIKRYGQLELHEPIAIVGSPGLRSIGSLVIDSLVNELKPELIADLYSTHFPFIYQTKPSYASHPALPGISGIKIGYGKFDFPKIQFYSYFNPPLIITQGYHANFAGQYEVAEQVLSFYEEMGVKRIIVVAGYGLKGKPVCCAANSLNLIKEINDKYGIEVDYAGPFYGFSGLVFGLAKLRNIDAFCLFGRTDPLPENPEQPDETASKNLLDILSQILNLVQIYRN